MTADSLVFEGAQIIDGTGAVKLGTLIVQGSTIQRIQSADNAEPYPKGARVINCQGKTIIPGIINLHGHLGLTCGLEKKYEFLIHNNVCDHLRLYAAHGVLGMVSLGTDESWIYQLRKFQRLGAIEGARLYTAGTGFSVTGGWPLAEAYPQVRYRPATREQAQQQVRELAESEPDFVKIWVDDEFGTAPKVEPLIYQAIIEEAHRHRLRVVAHVFYLDDARALVEAGLDGLAHSVRDKPVDNQFADLMLARGTFLMPTLWRDQVLSRFGEEDGFPWLDDPFFQASVGSEIVQELTSPEFAQQSRLYSDRDKWKRAFAIGQENFKSLADAGVRICMGTDSGLPFRFIGFAEHSELELLVKAGLSPMATIQSCTINNAEALGEARDYGTLEPGKQADFLILDQDPLKDMRHTRTLNSVWQSGRQVESIVGKVRK